MGLSAPASNLGAPGVFLTFLEKRVCSTATLPFMFSK